MPKTGEYKFKEHPSARARLRSAVHLIKLLLQENSEVLREHRQELLSIALWKVTEAESVHKHRTRFCSQTVYNAPESECRHDHVFQRAIMIRDLMNSGPDGVENILEGAVACTVTREEHATLDQHRCVDGWERYRRAGITVIDAKDGTIFRQPETE
jgi:hypothetical protein